MTMSVKVGFIGVGGIAKAHIHSLQKIENVEIVCIFDINRESASAVAELTGAQVMDSADQLLNPLIIDAVFICTPQFARDDLEETAARRGIHLFVEKPLGLDLETVRRKEKIILESGIIHAAGYCLRYYDTVREAKQYLQGKDIHLIQAHRFGTSHPSKWWKQLHMSGGHLVDAVTHQVDLIRFLAGEIEHLEAMFNTMNIKQLDPDATIYSAGAVAFSTESGTVGTLTESCLSPFHSGSDIKLFGNDFFILLSGNGGTLQIIDHEQNITKQTEMNAYYEQDRTFIQAIASGSQSAILSSYDDGARTLAVTLQANALAAKQN